MRSFRSLSYLVIFLPPLLLVAGRELRFDLLLPASFFVGLPALRLVFGSAAAQPILDWTDAVRRFLEWLPRVYSVVLAATMVWIAVTASSFALQSVQERVFFAVAVLVLGGVAECVAHELAHRRNVWDRRAGHVIDAVVGYPFFAFEHWDHHAHASETVAAHCPRVGENVWAYAARRAIRAPRQALALSQRRYRNGMSSSVLDDLRLYVGLTLCTWCGFTVMAGWYGFVLFGVLVLGVPFLLNAITYIQHWGLGDDSGAVPAGEQIGWDEDANLQSKLILGISFHYQHHRDAGRPYYLYGPTRGAPKLPAEYALMVLVSFVPPLWRLIMLPVLERWNAAQYAHGQTLAPDFDGRPEWRRLSVSEDTSGSVKS